LGGIFIEIGSDWKKGIEKELKKLNEFGKIDFEKVPVLVKRCPKCHSISLEFDAEKGRIYCTKCGFEEHIPII